MNIKSECRRLWKEAFGDSDEFISSFMKHYYSMENMLYVKEGNRLLSMVHIIPFLLDSIPVAYIYAVATDNKKRGKGYATGLIQQVIEKAKNDDYKAIITLPANNGLQDFYSRFGFKGRFAVKFNVADGFDFGTGDSAKDFATILILDKNFEVIINEKKSITLKR